MLYKSYNNNNTAVELEMAQRQRNNCIACSFHIRTKKLYFWIIPIYWTVQREKGNYKIPNAFFRLRENEHRNWHKILSLLTRSEILTFYSIFVTALCIALHLSQNPYQYYFINSWRTCCTNITSLNGGSLNYGRKIYKL